jgi:hypothetical protein
MNVEASFTIVIFYNTGNRWFLALLVNFIDRQIKKFYYIDPEVKWPENGNYVN